MGSEGEEDIGGTIPQTCEMNSADTFKILVASDIHLGFMDGNAIRENDSFNSFEEILQIAKDEEVDFVLLGGDLFHENKPKPATLKRTFDILHNFVLGDKPVAFEYLGAPEKDFRSLENPTVNFYSEHMNIGMPIFTIHGNHDDPLGNKKTSAVDYLASAGLLNHFGMYDDLNQVEIAPVLLKKGDTYLSLYGLGSMKDERLFRLFRDKKVRFMREAKCLDDWFNVFVLHQNRAKHGPTNYIPPNFFPSFLNLIIWGHEHECRIETEDQVIGGIDNESKICRISQPGSSVATSLAPGESVPKCVGILHINRKNFKIEKRPLETVRPFLIQDFYTTDILTGITNDQDPDKYLETYIHAKVNQMITDACEKLTGHPKQPDLPLIRVRIGYSDESEIFNGVRFAQKFCGKIANDDIVDFKKCVKRGEKMGNLDVGDIDEMILAEEDHDLEGHVEEIVEAFFTEGRRNNEKDKMLEVLSEKGLTEAVKSCVDKNDKDAISLLVDHQINKTVKHLISKQVTKDNIDDLLEELRDARNAVADEEEEDTRRVLNQLSRQNGSGSVMCADDPMGEDEVEVIVSRNGRRAATFDDDDDEVEEVQIEASDSDEEPLAVSKGRGRGRGSRGARGAAPKPTARGGRGSRARSSRGGSRRSGF